MNKKELAKKFNPRQEIAHDYLQAYRDYVSEMKKTKTNPVSLNDFAKFHSIRSLRRNQ